MPDNALQNTKRSSWFMKFAECLLTAIALVNLTFTFIELFSLSGLIKPGDDFIVILFSILSLLAVLFAIVFTAYWHKKIRVSVVSARVHSLFRGIVRYWLAFSISLYGFAKILKTQFGHSFQREDTLVGNLNGFNLTWQYFSHSYALAIIIACLQIGGSILLLFRRTTLLGVIILLPVLINILLINIFYKIAIGAFINSILFVLGLCYFLLLRWADLRKIFLHATDSLPVFRLGVLKHFFRLLPIAGAFLIIWYFTLKSTPAIFIGKWKVDLMTRNGDTVKTNPWIPNYGMWSNVYVEDYGQVAICGNPYFFDKSESQFASYHYDDAKKNIQLVFAKTGDTANIKLSNYDNKKMEWRGIIGHDTTAIWFSRAE